MLFRSHVTRELSLSYGVSAEYGELELVHDRFIYHTLVRLEKAGELSDEDMVVVVGGSFGANKGASFMEISKVIHLINKALMD